MASTKGVDRVKINEILDTLGIQPVNYGATSGGSRGWIETAGPELVSYSPIDGSPIAKVIQAGRNDYETVMARAETAFETYRMMPAPRRGRLSEK